MILVKHYENGETLERKGIWFPSFPEQMEFITKIFKDPAVTNFQLFIETDEGFKGRTALKKTREEHQADLEAIFNPPCLKGDDIREVLSANVEVKIKDAEGHVMPVTNFKYDRIDNCYYINTDLRFA